MKITHALAGAWCFRHLRAKRMLTACEETKLELAVKAAAQTICEHEEQIIKLMFETMLD